MSVGDINSAERGSGARFNSGKPDVSLIPLTLLASYFWFRHGDSDVVRGLAEVGKFQEGGDPTEDRTNLSNALTFFGFNIKDCSDVFLYGKQKYAAWNWAKGMAWSIPIACIGRHAERIIVHGEELDSESGLPHLGHIHCNIIMLLTYLNNYPEGDDRPIGILGDTNDSQQETPSIGVETSGPQ